MATKPILNPFEPPRVPVYTTGPFAGRPYLGHVLVTHEPPPFEQMRTALRKSVERVSLTTASGEDLDALAKSVGAPTDPWVVVGTTTIDGTLEQVNALFGVDAVGKTTSLGPTLVGGRMLKPTGWHLNRNLGGEALVFCDIIRRQSEIDAEERRASLRHDPSVGHNYPSLPCPECGPHGNAGEVMLASSWAKCTTCNGGKAGDLWGEVKHEKSDGGFPDDQLSIKDSPAIKGPFVVTIDGHKCNSEAAQRMMAEYLEGCYKRLRSLGLT